MNSVNRTIPFFIIAGPPVLSRMISGNYVRKFADASHALPDGMPTGSDYPFILPKIVAVDGKCVVIRSDDGWAVQSAKIRKSKGHGQYCVISQSSTFEKLYRRPPRSFTFWPFKGERTHAVGEGQAGTSPA